MRRTPTTNLSTFSRPSPSAVTYSLPSPAFSAHEVTITLPPGSVWTSGLHWHETHTEYLKVLQGVALVTLHGITERFTPESGIITVPRYARHEWRRADHEGGVLVVREWTNPADGEKEIFFRNLNSIILDETKDGPPREWVLELELWNLFWRVDNWPSFYPFGWLPLSARTKAEWALTHVVLFLAVVLGWFLGVKGVYEEYTPNKKIEKSSKELR